VPNVLSNAPLTRESSIHDLVSYLHVLYTEWTCANSYTGIKNMFSAKYDVEWPDIAKVNNVAEDYKLGTHLDVHVNFQFSSKQIWRRQIVNWIRQRLTHHLHSMSFLHKLLASFNKFWSPISPNYLKADNNSELPH
jgi:hypothetical protein